MPVDFSNHNTGLIHGPAWAAAPAIESILSDAALAAPVPKNFDWHMAMGLGRSAPDDLGNRIYSCCVEAGSYRLAQMRMANAMGSAWKPNTAQVLKTYSAWTDPPFDLLSGANDTGTLVATAQQKLWQIGLDLGLQAPDVCVPVTLDHTDLATIRRAAWLLGGVGLCFALPVGWQTATLWNAGAGAPGSWGVHFVPCGRYSSGLWYPITWGLEIPTTDEALAQYLTGAYAWVSRNWLEVSSLTPTGLTWDALAGVRRGLESARG